MGKTTKKLAAIFLAFIMVLGAVPITGFDFSMKASAVENGLSFKLNDDGNSYSVFCDNDSLVGDLVIPAIYNGKPVTVIDSDAFFYCIGLVSVVIPSSVTSIGADAFYNCTSLASIVIPSSVTSISYSAFENCTSLASIVIPSSVTDIGSWAFDNTAYYNNAANWVGGVLYIGGCLIDANEDISGSYAITDGTRLIADSAFDCCEELASVSIPSSVTSIGDEAFEGCTSLASITIPSSVTSIGNYAFYDTAYYNNAANWVDNVLYISGCLIEANEDINGNYAITDGTRLIANSAFRDSKNLTFVSIPSSVTSIGDEVFSYCENLTSVSIPSSVTSIGYGAFVYCTSLASITIPTGVTSIGYFTFIYCRSLTSVSISSSVTNIGDRAFDNCTNLTSVTVDEANENYKSVDGVLLSKDGTRLIKYPCRLTGTNYIIDDAVTSIGYGAFENCTSLASITLPNSVTSIGDGAFAGCTSLASIVIPSSVTSIGYEAFEGCTSLASITLPNSVTSIYGGAFEGCTSLASITLPNNVTSIGYGAFSNCTSLASIVIPSSVTSIDSCAFEGCTSLASITLGDNVTSIGVDAFDGTAYYFDYNNWQPYLDYDEKAFLFIGNYLICVRDYLVYEGFDVNYTIPDGTTLIADNAFQDCYCLTSVSVPSSVTSIGDRTFYNCTSLTSVSILSGVTSIGSSAFEDCTSLVSIVIPSSVTSIGDWTFYNCTGLTSVSIPSSVTSIGSGAFEDCTSLASIVIPSSVTSIDYSAFNNCTSLSSIVIPSSVTSIGYWSFAYCSALTDVYYGGTESEKALISIDNDDHENDNLINAAWHYLSDITVNAAGTKTSYYVGDAPKAELKASYTDGKTNLLTSGLACTPAKFSTSGTQTITTSYSGKSCTFTATVIVAPEKVSDVLSIQAPSKTTVKYGDTLILHANVGNLPDGAKVVWDVQGSGVMLSPADDGTVCDVTSVESGKVTVTATVVRENGETLKDASGNKVSVSQELNSKAGFFWRFISFIKDVLGIGRIIFQSIEAK